MTKHLPFLVVVAITIAVFNVLLTVMMMTYVNF